MSLTLALTQSIPNRNPKPSSYPARDLQNLLILVRLPSGCGNYGLVGTRGGHVFRYNMQSGQPRGSYPQSATPSAKAVKALTNVMKPGAIAKITPGGFASKRIGATVFASLRRRFWWS